MSKSNSIQPSYSKRAEAKIITSTLAIGVATVAVRIGKESLLLNTRARYRNPNCPIRHIVIVTLVLTILILILIPSASQFLNPKPLHSDPKPLWPITKPALNEHPPRKPRASLRSQGPKPSSQKALVPKVLNVSENPQTKCSLAQIPKP